MVTFKDSAGMPRAWAIGPTIESASNEAKRQLSIYRGEKASLNDPLASDSFVESVDVLEFE